MTMSVLRAEAVFLEVLDILSRQPVPEISQTDLLAALNAGRLGPLPFLYEAGVEAGLPHKTLLTRAAAIYFNFCAGNLADDLMDSECTYLSEPFRLGPCVQYILQTLCFQTLLEANLPSPVCSSFAQELVAAAGQQLVEVRTKQWSASLFRDVAEGIAGRQWSAYMQILWCGTPLANRAATIGMNGGVAAHVVKDMKSQDLRYTTMPEADKREIVAWAMAAAHALREEHLRCLDAMLLTIDPVLQEAS
jgi:hypothetical protein